MENINTKFLNLTFSETNHSNYFERNNWLVGPIDLIVPLFPKIRNFEYFLEGVYNPYYKEREYDNSGLSWA